MALAEALLFIQETDLKFYHVTNPAILTNIVNSV